MLLLLLMAKSNTSLFRTYFWLVFYQNWSQFHKIKKSVCKCPMSDSSEQNGDACIQNTVNNSIDLALSHAFYIYREASLAHTAILYWCFKFWLRALQPIWQQFRHMVRTENQNLIEGNAALYFEGREKDSLHSNVMSMNLLLKGW